MKRMEKLLDHVVETSGIFIICFMIVVLAFHLLIVIVIKLPYLKANFTLFNAIDIPIDIFLLLNIVYNYTKSVITNPGTVSYIVYSSFENT